MVLPNQPYVLYSSRREKKREREREGGELEQKSQMLKY